MEHSLNDDLVRPAALRPTFGPLDELTLVPVPAAPYGAFTTGCWTCAATTASTRTRG